MYHYFCIHSSVDGHLGYFHVLAIVESAVTNTGEHVSLSIRFSKGICPVFIVLILIFLLQCCHIILLQ